MPQPRHGYQGIEWTWFIENTDSGGFSGPFADTERLIQAFIQEAHRDQKHLYRAIRCSHGEELSSTRYRLAYYGRLETPTVYMNPDSVLFLVPNKMTRRWNYERPYGTRKRPANTVHSWRSFAALLKRRKVLKFRVSLH